jgi:hypothetical protein
VPGVFTGVYGVHVSDATDGSGKVIDGAWQVGAPGVSPKPLPGFHQFIQDGVAVNPSGTAIYVVSKRLPFIWRCINPLDRTGRTTLCDQIGTGIDQRIFQASYNAVDDNLYLAGNRFVQVMPHADSCGVDNPRGIAGAPGCAVVMAQMTLTGSVFEPQALISWGRFLYAASLTNIVQQDVVTGEFAIYAGASNSTGAFPLPTAIGIDPVGTTTALPGTEVPGALIVMADTTSVGLNAGTTGTRMRLCPNVR